MRSAPSLRRLHAPAPIAIGQMRRQISSLRAGQSHSVLPDPCPSPACYARHLCPQSRGEERRPRPRALPLPHGMEESDCLGNQVRIPNPDARFGFLSSCPALPETGLASGQKFPQATVRAWENGGVGPCSPAISTIEVVSGLAPRQRPVATESHRIHVTRWRAQRAGEGQYPYAIALPCGGDQLARRVSPIAILQAFGLLLGRTTVRPSRTPSTLPQISSGR